MRIVTLPAKRISRLLRNNARALRELERLSGVEVFIRDEPGALEGEVEVSGEDSEKEWLAEQALLAIDLGFEPKHAFKVFKENHYLEIVDLGEAMHGKANAVSRQKARIIGTGGSAKEKLEKLSEANLALSDDARVGIVGEFEEVKAAKEAILRLLEGAHHAGVFAYLKKEKDLRESRRMGAHI